MQHRWLRVSVLLVCFAAAAVSGYMVSAELGAETLRREAQSQLSTLMQGSVRIARTRLVVRGGLFIEGDRVGVYPSESAPHGPALFASHVSAELDVLALLLGRFRLNGLRIDDAVLEIRRRADGRWSPTPFQALASRRRSVPSDDMERSLDLIHAFEAITRTLLEKPLIAGRVEVRRGRITFVDQTRQDRDDPVELALYQINGRLVHHWLSGDADLRLTASLVDREQRTVPLKAEGWQRDGEAMRLSLTAAGLPIATLAPYLLPSGGTTRLGGALSGEIAYETRAEQHGIVTLQAEALSFATTVDVRDGHYEIERPLVAIDAALEIHPGRARLVNGRIDAEGIAFTLSGSVDRPLGPAARARIEVDVDGLELDEVREIVRSLPDADAATLESVLARVDEGRIDRIGARGTARLDEWGPLLVGEGERLPRGFVLTATASEVRARAGPTDWLSEVGGHLELTGDQLTLESAVGFWNAEPLPKLSVSIEGVSRLFRGPESVGQLTASAGPLPGLSPLWHIARGDAEGSIDEDPSPRIILDVERLEHPILRWPLTETHIVVDGTATGVRMVFERGRWAGAPFVGEAEWIAEPREDLTVSVQVQPRSDDPPRVVPPSSPRSGEVLPWASGGFEIAAVPNGPVPMRSALGRFRVTESRVRLLGFEAELAPTGRLSADLDLELGDSEEVGVELRFDVAGGDVERIGEAFGIPRGSAIGRLDLTGELAGPIRPQVPILTSLAGHARLTARDGEVRRDELPLVLALAQASAGYNEYAERDAIAYDSIEAGFALLDGRISTEDFELDGPLRVYGSGTVDAVRPPHEIVAVVGLFLFRSAGQIMQTIPLVKAILPGSEKGLVGAYFQVSGPLENPNVETLAGKSIGEDLPDLLAAPYHILRAILTGGNPEEGRTTPDPK